MSNVQNNDERILLLKKQIETKKEKLGKSPKFTPVTNCSIEYNGARSNINTLNKEQLINLLVHLNSLRLSAKELGLLDEYKISGYSVEEWIEDIFGKLNLLSRKDEEKTLKLMENKLSTLLSEQKKAELEIDEIESLLKENKND